MEWSSISWPDVNLTKEVSPPIIVKQYWPHVDCASIEVERFKAIKGMQRSQISDLPSPTPADWLCSVN